MNRRAFLAASVALATVPAAAFAAGVTIDFDKSDPIKKALAEGKTVFVGFSADWCSTCARQERVMGSLRSENPAYDENIVFIRVDWDEFGRTAVATSRNVPRRSTLIALKGDKELGRIVAGTSASQIQELMDKALAAAKSA